MQDWPEFKRLQASVFNGTKPRIAVQVHANVPGIGDSLWDLYLHPWQHYLQSRGCDLRLTTVLRAGISRISRVYLAYILRISPLYLACISAQAARG